MTTNGSSKHKILKRDKANAIISHRFQIEIETQGRENNLYPRSDHKVCNTYISNPPLVQSTTINDPTALPRPSPTFSPIVVDSPSRITTPTINSNISEKSKERDFVSPVCTIYQDIDRVRNTSNLDAYFPTNQYNRSPWNECTSRLMNAKECRPEQFIPQDPRFPCLRTHQLQ
jgi:hypothetical protein